MHLILGVDVSKKSLDVAMLPGPQKAARRKFGNRPSGLLELADWVASLPASMVTVAMEATGVYGALLARFAFDQGWRVFVLNPSRVKAYGTALGQGNKTDRADCLLIAQYAQRTPDLTPWEPVGPEREALRALVRERLHAQQLLQAERNREESAPLMTRPAIRSRIELLSEQVKALWQEIRRLIKADDALKQSSGLLESIPGIGPWSAAVLLSELPRIDAKTSARQVAALFGLCPRIMESGTTLRATRLSGRGRRLLSHQLFMPALAALKHNPALRSWASGLAARGKMGKQIIAAAIHKLVRLAVGVLKSKQQFTPAWKGASS